MVYDYCSITDYLYTPDFFETVLHVISYISIPVHCYGGFCVFAKTPISMQSVKWSMMNLHLFSCLFDLGVSLFTIPYILFPVLAGYPLGLMQKFGVPIEIQVYEVLFVGAFMLVSITIVFENRLFVLVLSDKTLQRFRTPIYILHYILPIIFLPALVNIPDQKAGYRNLMDHFECVPPYVDIKKVFYLAITKRYFLGGCASFIVAMFVEVWFFAFITNRMLKKQMTKTMSQKTVDLHRKFQRAFILQIQLLIPFIIVFLPICYVGFSCFAESAFHNQALNNITIIIISSHGFFSTIAMIALHTPYREYTQQLFPFCKRLDFSSSNQTAPQSVMVTNM